MTQETTSFLTEASEDNDALSRRIQITGINSTDVSADAASESFDEPLTKDQVLAIVDPFIN